MTNCVQLQLLMIHCAALRMQKHVDDKPSIKPKVCFVKTMYFVIYGFVLRNCEIVFDS